MTTRKTVSHKKCRGIPRRLRALAHWAASYDTFPLLTAADYARGHWNIKLPVHSTLVDGNQTNQAIRAACAQSLINAAWSLYCVKPVTQPDLRVTCCIALPEMFFSELCIFTTEAYFTLQTQPAERQSSVLKLLTNRSLCKAWSLVLPEPFGEIGVLNMFETEEGVPHYVEQWFIGEVNRK